METIESGRIRARGASRVFTLNVVKERSLKEAILRRKLPPRCAGVSSGRDRA